MKVKELIDQLLTFDQDCDIVVDGYEGGVTEYLSIEKVKVVCNINNQWYYGEHEIDDDLQKDINEEVPRKFVIRISRNRY